VVQREYDHIDGFKTYRDDRTGVDEWPPRPAERVGKPAPDESDNNEDTDGDKGYYDVVIDVSQTPESRVDSTHDC
jgi:hypothetical protein